MKPETSTSERTSVASPPLRSRSIVLGSIDLGSIDLGPIDLGPIDLGPISTLLSRIETQYHPEQVWLFGSRARGEARPWSDWDLFVVVPDNTPEEQLDPLFLWRLTRGSGVRVDVVACRASEFRDACDTVNTLSYVIATEGVRIDDR